MSRTFSRPKTAFYFRSRGLALVELMISLVLGLVIIGAVTGIMLSNMQGFQTTRGLSQVQDAARVGFELLARDIRQAGNVPCGNDIPVVNVLNSAQGAPSNVPWQYDFNNAFIGFDSVTSLNGVGNQIPDTESIVMLSGAASDIYVSDYPINNNGASFTIDTASGGPTGLADGEILLICNEKQAAIFQLTQSGNSGNGGGGNSGENVVVNTGGSTSPGNCSKGLGPVIPGNNPSQLCDTNGNPGPFDKNAVIASLSSVAWYIGDNSRPDEGGRSLYMARLGTNSGNAVLRRIEIASGVTDLNFRFRLIDTADFVDAATITAANRWADVNAVEISMSLLSQDQNISTSDADDGRLERSFTSVVAIRSRSL
jgi:type IV pilus assembly protein PilW